jgi:hypothetical protein
MQKELDLLQRALDQQEGSEDEEEDDGYDDEDDGYDDEDDEYDEEDEDEERPPRKRKPNRGRSRIIPARRKTVDGDSGRRRGRHRSDTE